MDIVSTLIGAGGNFATSAYNNWQAQKAQKDARRENYTYNEKAAENANERWRENYKDFFTPSAQLEMIKEAGLSPSLMMSGGAAGGGGTPPAPQGGGAQGLGNQFFPASALEAAQIAQLSAETEKTKAETDNINEQTIGQQLNNYITANNVDETLEQSKLTTANLAAQLQQTIAETSNIKWDTDFKTITQNDQWQALRNKNTLMLEQVLTEQTNRKLTDREREHYDTIFDKWQMDVYQKFVELDIKDWEVEYQNQWFGSQATYLENLINLGRDRLYFDKDYFEFDKIKWQQQRNQIRWQTATTTITDIAKIAVFGTASFMGASQGSILGGIMQKPMPKIGFNQ